jgi:hypothetical protein
MSDRVTVRIEGTDPSSEYIRLADFLHQLSALRDALKRTEEIVSGRTVLDWQIVDLSHNSPATVVLEPIVANDGELPPLNRREHIVGSFFRYFRTITETGKAPDELDRAALTAFKEIASPVRQERVRATISNGSESIEVLGAVETVVDAILKPKTHSLGSVEGRLEFINIHGGKNVFRVYPIVGASRVDCLFPRRLLTTAREAVGKEVRVFGDVVYLTRDPFPHSIRVDSVEVLPDDADLPSLLDIRGIAPLATGDLSSEDFVRELRGEEG